ncbi:MAG: radical SAM family heme chaperone HemW [Candidatus Dormibacteraeota bacterium]|uniref:Heme chaperone HemW n=1 Tax=Candidatus Aeolococcus gillhamiae TaxID=3127015 RepID=A0A934MZ66_9BACT|nr:radical SAM family heme chaperone HemW [Candidatus Dormibacteraeota bacterium]
MLADPGVSSLYLHIPYCERKCEYCDFVSVAGARGQHEYIAALRAEVRGLAMVLGGQPLRTVFVGGGTPGLLDLTLMRELMAEVLGGFDIVPDAEITLEVNPSSSSAQRARAWRTAGFNRVSVGVQSTHADILAFLGRVHDADRALAAVREVRAAGFDNVSADLIYAVPGLDDARWTESLKRVVEAGPDHISCYELTVESGTPLHRSVAEGRVRVVDPEIALRQHRIAVETLERAGYAQYEVSNFARDRRQCAHNLVYWRNGHYAAAGVGAHGHLPATLAPAFGLEAGPGALAFRYEHGRDIRAYVADRAAEPLTLRSLEWVDAGMRSEESIMLGLRLREGVRLEGDGVISEARELAAAGLLELNGARATVTSRGEDVLNQVALRLATHGA